MGTSLAIAVIIALALLLSWLGGGRKWDFRTMLSLLILVLLGGSGIFLFAYWTSKSTERQSQRLHECAIAKIATARCEPVKPKPEYGPWENYLNKADGQRKPYGTSVVPTNCRRTRHPSKRPLPSQPLSMLARQRLVLPRKVCTSRLANIGCSTASRSHKATSSINWSANVLPRFARDIQVRMMIWTMPL